MISSSFLAWVISIGITAFFHILFVFFLLPRFRTSRHLRGRWEQFGKNTGEKWDSRNRKMEQKRLRSLQVKNKLKNILSHSHPSFQRLEHLFYRADVFPHIKTHIIGQVMGTLMATEAIILFCHTSLLKAFVLGLLFSLAIHLLVLQSRERKWKKSFVKIFPMSLDIINRGLKSGMTLGRGIAMVAEEMEDPVGREFSYMTSQLQIGVSPDDALTESAERIGIDEFRFFSLALIIQREMGGSLADILGKLSELIRERDRFRQKVLTLSSEGRATAVIVGSLPLFLGVMVELISPGYMKFFIADPKGKIMLMVCGALSLAGFIVISRMMKLET